MLHNIYFSSSYFCFVLTHCVGDEARAKYSFGDEERAPYASEYISEIYFFFAERVGFS